MKAKKSMLNNDIMEIVHKLEKKFKGIRIMVRYQDFEGEDFSIHVPKKYSKLKKFRKFVVKMDEEYFMKEITNFQVTSIKIEKFQINELVYVSPYITVGTLLGKVY